MKNRLKDEFCNLHSCAWLQGQPHPQYLTVMPINIIINHCSE